MPSKSLSIPSAGARPGALLAGAPWSALVSIMLSLVVLLPKLDLLGVPSRDAGVFLYLGQRMLAGDLPYLDMWDHKPPGIYLLNALGLWLGRGSPVGVWAVEVAFLSVAIWLSWRLLREAFGAGPAMLATGLWLFGLTILLESGNVTEEYALAPQFGVWWLTYRWWGRRGRWEAMGVGACGMLCFLLRQNLAGVAALAALLMWADQLRSRGVRSALALAGWIGLGVLAAAAPVLAYLAVHDLWGPLWDAAFRYNSAYVQVPPAMRWESLRFGALAMARCGLSLAALVAWLILAAGGGRKQPLATRALLILALVDLPLEMGVSVLSGARFPHYYIPWLPVMAVLAAYLTSVALPWEAPKPAWRPVVPLVWITAGLLVAGLGPGQMWVHQVANLRHSLHRQSDVVAYVRETTGQEDYLLMWGAETSLHQVTGRRSPSRYVYLYPLLKEGYQSAEMVQEFLDDLQAHPPALIIDTSATNCTVPPLDPALRQDWTCCREGFDPLPEMQQVYDYVLAHYQRAPEPVGLWVAYLPGGR
ncbi:MAG: hypothetical protein ACYC5M_01000 [Anaerolineae bacterium]